MNILNTEKRNEKTTHIDKMDSLEMMKVIQEENYNAVKAIESELPEIAKAVDAISLRMKDGGRLFYVGCGTSGRLGVLDASECPPTYGVSYDTVIGLMAGGVAALSGAGEAEEDSFEDGYRDISAHHSGKVLCNRKTESTATIRACSRIMFLCKRIKYLW